MNKTLIDRYPTHNIKNFDRMVVELSKYMTDIEIDKCVDFINTISDSRWDVNPSITESVTQLKLIIGSERYEQCKVAWSVDNQHLLGDGVVKYIRKSDGSRWDGLDIDDNPDDYERILL